MNKKIAKKTNPRRERTKSTASGRRSSDKQAGLVRQKPELRLSEDASSWFWRDENTCQNGWEAGKTAVSAWWFGALYAVALFIPAGLVTILLIGGATYYRTGQFTSQGGIADPLLWGWIASVIVGCGAVIGLFLCFTLLCHRNVVAFAFDGKTQTLSYTEVTPFRKTRHWVVPFERIISVTPTLMTTYAYAGHLEVIVTKNRVLAKAVPGSPQDRKSLTFGGEIGLLTMEACAAWLTPYLGNRVEPTLRMDT